MMEYLDEHPDVDIIAPELVNLPWLYTSHRRESLLFTGALPPLRPFGEVVAGAVVVPKVANVFLARTDSLREVGWDERLRLVEHQDFFSGEWRLVCVQADRGARIPSPHAVRRELGAIPAGHRSGDDLPRAEMGGRACWRTRGIRIRHHARGSDDDISRGDPRGARLR